MFEGLRVRIREATAEDLPALEWEGEYRHFRRLYRRTLEDARKGRGLMLLAEVDGRVVGQVFVQFDVFRPEMPRGTRVGYLYAFRVRPEYRRRGIGTQLIHQAEQALRERGMNRAVIAVARENVGALRLYERLGYRRFAEDPGEWSYVDHKGRLRKVHEPAYLLEKPL